MFCQLCGMEVKFRQTQAVTDLVAGMGREEESHALGTEVTLIVLRSCCCMDLRIRVQVAHTWRQCKWTNM